jgi:hypothetical protein
MNRKLVLIQGIILITIILVANVLLTNWFISERIEEIKVRQDSMVRSLDHIYTALTYMEMSSSNEKVKYELDAAKESLRAPELMMIRRKVD